MDTAERLRTYVGLAESTRRWVAVMDTKAGFLSALNGALLTFMWIGARLADVVAAVKWLAFGASLCSLMALFAALWIIIPRQTTSAVMSRRTGLHGEIKPVSFYGYVATQYAGADFQKFEAVVTALDEGDFAREALEQHFIVSRIVEAKSGWVTISGRLTLASAVLAGAALLLKTLYA